MYTVEPRISSFYLLFSNILVYLREEKNHVLEGKSEVQSVTESDRNGQYECLKSTLA